MIVQEINKYQHPVWNPPESNVMGKLEYALYLRNLPFKPGTFVTLKSNEHPYQPWQVYRIDSIDEIHRYVQFTPYGPLCLSFSMYDGIKPSWKASPMGYKEVDHAFLPKEWKDRL